MEKEVCWCSCEARFESVKELDQHIAEMAKLAVQTGSSSNHRPDYGVLLDDKKGI